MADFHEVLFPVDISYGSSGGPKFKTTIFDSDSGFEQRNKDWSKVRSEFDVSHGIKDADQMDELRAFFYARQGRAHGFRYKDWGDFRLRQGVIGIGDGETTTFQIVKRYRSQQIESGEAYYYERPLTKIAWGTTAGVTVGGVVTSAWTVDHNKGLITFDTAPEYGDEIKIGALEFHVPVRFDTDHLDVTEDFWNTESWSSIPLREVRDWEEVLVGDIV